MSFVQRVATIATMTFGFIAIAGGSTPGFAFQIDPVFNATSGLVVPTDPDSLGIQAETLANDERLPSETPPQSARPADVEQDHAARTYASLSQAVTAQDTPDTMSAELRCLAGAIYFEAKGEPLSGQLAVAEVILNRAKSGRFAKSACAVVTQAGQFSFVRGGRVPAIGDNANYRTAIAVAQVAMGDHWDSPAPRALYFHARRVSPGWRMQKVASIGNHVFYR